MKTSKPQPIKSTLLQKIGAKAGISAAGTGAKAIGNFAKNNPDLVKTGINIIGENFGKDVELGGNAAAF
jgi:broad specificity polyphosphatase/5'/3'-nucleotidase SurE